MLKLVASSTWRATGNGGADGLAQDDIVGRERLAVAELPRLGRDVVLFKAEPAVEIQAPPVGEEAGQHDLGDGRQVGGDGGMEGHEQRAQAGSEPRLVAGTGTGARRNSARAIGVHLPLQFGMEMDLVAVDDRLAFLVGWHE